MSANSEEIIQRALALPPQDRAEIVEHLLASFQVPPDPQLDELWAREAEDRLGAYDRGELSAVPEEEVLPESNDSALNEKNFLDAGI